MRRYTHGVPAALVAAALAAVVAGCGSSGGSSTTSASAPASTAPSTAASTTASTTASTSATAAPSATAAGYRYAGTAADTARARTMGAAAAGGTATPPSGRSIGIIQLSGQSATSIAVADAAKQIGKTFGYKVNVCDPAFDAQKIPQCATSIVAQNPSVVFSVSTNPGPLGSAIQQAHSRGIPWFNVGSAATKSPLMNDYGIDGFALARVLDQYMFRAMAARNTGSSLKLFAITAPTVGVSSLNSETQLRADVRAAGNVTPIIHDLDLANATQDTLTTSRATLEQNPDLAGMWTLCDFCVPLMAQAVSAREGSNRHTIVAGMFSSPETIADIRRGTVDAVADYAWALPVWVGMDQVLQNWARRTPIAQGSAAFGGYGLPFMQPYLITRANALASGPAPIYGPDYESYFEAKWSKEFGVG